MIKVIINDTTVRHTLIDNGADLNICSIDLLEKISVDKKLIQLNDVKIYGFDNVNRQPLGMIKLHIEVRLVVLPTPIHIIPRPLSYKLLLGRPWIHAMKVVPYTLHHVMNFEYNNKICMVDAYEKIYKSYDHNTSNSLNTFIPK
jgi:hypothetical protein